MGISRDLIPSIPESKGYVFEHLQDGRFTPKIAKIFPIEHTTERMNI